MHTPGLGTHLPPAIGLRDLNRLRVIESIYRHPATSRADIARRTGLARATVSTVVEELGRARLVQEQEALDDTRPRGTGRPPTLLSLVPAAAFAVGLDIGHQHVRVTMCDLTGESVGDEWSSAEVDHAPSQTLDVAHDLIRRVLRTADVEPGRLLGIGMGIAAPINHITGELEADGIMPGWHGIAPAAEIETRLGLPVELANDADVGALGENVFGAGQGVDNMAYVRLSAGVGAGLILAGQPYHGSRGVAGEIGHTCIDANGMICRCGNRGCLETVASPVAVARLLERSTGTAVSVPRMFELIASGDRGARRAVADAGEAVGRVLASLVNTLNPELIVIGGELAASGDVLLDPIRDMIQRHSVGPAAAGVRVTAGTLGDRAEVLGAAALVLAQSPRALAGRVMREES